jgi:hypothetical protein
MRETVVHLQPSSVGESPVDMARGCSLTQAHIIPAVASVRRRGPAGAPYRHDPCSERRQCMQVEGTREVVRP